MKDKVVVITGAGGVLCSVIAQAYAAKGAKVAVLDINEAAAGAVADKINASGGIAKAYAVNCLDKSDLIAAHAAITADLGKCDLLVNGAGGNNPKGTASHDYYGDGSDLEGVKTFFDLEADGIDFVFKLNFLATLLTTQVFAPDMIGREGNIINISSMNAFRPLTRIPAYSGAKAAVSNFTQWLAVYFAKSGIRVNAIAPGFFVTNQNKSLLFDKDGNPSERSKKILAGTPMGRFGEAEEILGTLFYLTDNKAASFVTGVVIPIDGGFSAYSGV
ncbi:MAG: SDR family oxidoreductase [Clostridia bacterium]|nr:SDR family oxidoreductase [Clostridia bacterium]